MSTIIGNNGEITIDGESVTTRLNNIAEIITADDLFVGVEDHGDIVAEWANTGLSLEQIEGYANARCFDAERAQDLAEAGITVEQAAQRTSAGLGDYTDTVGYKFANGDIGPADIA